jgi:iron complex outermembrane receptor protein
MKTILRVVALATPFAFGTATIATAQTIDYGSLEQLFNEPVTTSATGSPQRSTDAPVAMEIITAADIQRSGATDLPTILSRVSGVDVLTWGANGAADVSIRGYDSPYSSRLLVLINGRQVYLDHFGYTAWSSLPVELAEIRQIEVVKGPNSALFGFNAVGGVINIITYNPKYDQDKSSATATVGTQRYGETNAVESFKLGSSFFARISAGASQSNQWDNETSAGTVTPAVIVNPYRLATNLDTLTQLAESTQLRVEGSYSLVRQSDVEPLYTYTDPLYRTESLKATLTSETALGLAELSAYTNHLDVQYLFGSGLVDWANTITVVHAQDLFKLGASSTVRLALEYRHNKLPDAPIGPGVISYDVVSPSVMWNWAATDKLSFTTAVRVDHLTSSRTGGFPAATPFIPGLPGLTWPLSDNSYFDRTITPVSENAGLVYRASANDTIRLSFARGIELPSLIQLGGIQYPYPTGSIPAALMGNPQIGPSVITNYEVGYDHAITELNARAGVKAFYQHTANMTGNPSASNLIAPPNFAVIPGVGPVPTSLPGIGWANVGSSTMRGAEFEITGESAEHVRWGLNYTYTKVTDEAYAGQDLLAANVAYDKTTPKSRANFNLGWTQGPWTSDAYLRYVSSTQMFSVTGGPLVGIDQYFTLAGRVAYAFSKSLKVALSGENLTKNEQTQTSGLLAPRRALLSLEATW